MFRNEIFSPNESDIAKIISVFHPLFGGQDTLNTKKYIRQKLEEFYFSTNNKTKIEASIFF